MLKREKPDVVHILGKFLFLPTAVCSSILKITYFFTVLDYYIICPRNMLLRPNNELCTYNHGKTCADCFLLSENKLAKKLDKLIPKVIKGYLCILRKWSVDYFMNKASKIITFSQTSKQRLIKYGYKDNKVEVCYHYKFQTAANSSKMENNGCKKILFVGSLTEHKGLDVIIKAMSEVISKVPNVKLLVVGKGKKHYIDYINNLIMQNALGSYIEFLGHRTNEEVLRLINEADIVVVPEQWHSEFGPVILIEAKLSKKPVVASNIGSIPEFVRDGVDGILTDYNSCEQFSNGIIALFRDKNSADKMGNSISNNVYRLMKSEEMLERLEGIYKN